MPIRSEQEASLVCFGEPPALIELKSVAKRDGELLTLDFFVKGEIGDLRLPPAHLKPERRDGLWESTCFEAFVSEPDQEYYWELNLSPAGHWNLYHFRGYREGRKNEMRISDPRIEVLERAPDAFHLRAFVDLSRVLGPRALLDLGMTAVLESGADSGKSYWALAHFGAKPDFHLRKSFQLRV